MTHFIEKTNKNLLLDAGLYFTTDLYFQKNDTVKVQKVEERYEQTYDVMDVIKDAPLTKKDVSVIILKIRPADHNTDVTPMGKI